MDRPAFQDLLLTIFRDGQLDRALHMIHKPLQFVMEYEDFVQEVLIRAWQARDKFVGKTPADLLRYLQPLARHLLVDFLRRRSKEKSTQPLGLNEPSEFNKLSFLSRSSETVLEVRDWVQWLLAELSPTEQRVLYERYWLEKELPQIALELGWTYRAVVQAHYRAIVKLRAMLDRRSD